MAALYCAPTRFEPLRDGTSASCRQPADHALRRNPSQENRLVTTGASSRDLDALRTSRILHQVDDRSVRLVLVRCARHPDFHAIAVYANDPRPACVRQNQQIDFNSAFDGSNRCSLHVCTVPTLAAMSRVVFRNAVTGTRCPRQMEMSDRCWCETGSING